MAPEADVTIREPLFEWVEGEPRFRELPVKRDVVRVASREFRIARMHDPAALLDHPDFAHRFLEDNQAPYGLELWPSSLMLAEIVLTGEAGDGRRAVDLGCGLGLVSMAAQQAGWHITATDNEPTSLRFTEYNAETNEIRLDAIEALDWREPPSDRKYDRVFGADLLYELINHAPLLSCIERLLAEGGVALIVDPNRRVADSFASTARDYGFEVEVNPTSKQSVDDCEASGRVFRMRRRPG